MRYVPSGAFIAVVAIVATVATGCGGDDSEPSNSAAQAEPVKIRYGQSAPVPTVGQAFFTSVPEELGYFADEGLEVKINGWDGSGACMTAVAAGQLDVCTGGATSLVASAQHGAEMKAFYNALGKDIYAPRVPADSGIKTLDDYRGKSIGVQSLQAGSLVELQGLLDAEGIDANDVEFVPVGVGPTAAEALRTGKVDALQLGDTQYAAIENILGQPQAEVEIPGGGVVFQLAVVASTSALEKKRDAMAGFGRALAKGLVFTEANREAAIRIHWKHYPETKTPGASDETAMKNALAEMDARLSDSTLVDETYGLVTTEQVERVAQMVGADDIAADQVWTDALIPAINKFDRDEVTQEAKAYGD